jgi:hypothetical protein
MKHPFNVPPTIPFATSFTELPHAYHPPVVVTGEPLVYQQGGVEVYPTLPGHTNPMELAFGVRDDTRKMQAVMGHAARIFPGEHFTPISTVGSSCTVLANDKGMAFKIFNNANHYSYVVDEARAIEKMHRLDLGPRLIGFIDAAEQFRTSSGIPPKREFADIAIPRINGNGPVPVIVTERVDTSVPVLHLPAKKLLDEFDRIWPIVLEEGLILEDVETYFDRRTQSVKFIDVGPLNQFSPDRRRYIFNGSQAIDRYPDLTDEQLKEFDCLRCLVGAISGVFGGDERQLYLTYKTKGLSGVHAIIKERVTQAKQQERAVQAGAVVGISRWLSRPKAKGALYKSARAKSGRRR